MGSGLYRTKSGSYLFRCDIFSGQRRLSEESRKFLPRRGSPSAPVGVRVGMPSRV
jgi:hypothetical protein